MGRLRMQVLLIAVATLLGVLGLGQTSAAASPTFDGAIDQLVASGYARNAEAYLNSLGSNALGCRDAGSPADRTAARYILGELRSIGLQNVRLEPVPVDAWVMKGATMSVGGQEMFASQYGGIPGTPCGGITAEIVYVHDGHAQDYEGLNVRGKLVLVDYNQDFWRRLCGAEATAHGAAGVIATYGPNSGVWGSIAPDALVTFDGEYSRSWAPMVYVSRQDGDWIKTQLAAAQGPVTGTLTSTVDVTMATNGGIGYNVIGELPGTDRTAPFILISGHHDCHFRAGQDDTGGIVNMLQMAKAMKMSGFTHRRTIVFLFTTAEEYGRTDAHYDYLIGAWYAITHAHRDWPGRIAVDLNLESMAPKGRAILFTLTRDPALNPWLQSLLAANGSLLPYGGLNLPLASATDDSWTIGAAGVPALMIACGDLSTYYRTYHTQYDNIDTVDWGTLGQCAKYMFRMVESVDSGVLPHSLAARASDLAAKASLPGLATAGVPAGLLTRLQEDIATFQQTAQSFELERPTIPAWKSSLVNALMLNIEKSALRGFAALDVNDNSIYPHNQVLANVLSLDAALHAIDGSSPNTAAALSALSGVDRTRIGLAMTQSVYLQELAQHDPSYSGLYWGGQGKLFKLLNVVPQYRAVERGDYALAISDLTSMRDAELTELTSRVASMCNLVEVLTWRLQVLNVVAM